mgnify:CR=1 FL=1|tara:strand:- start:188 stop:406 length:219 start_codon:yes stop_codon:yes gene_type:complete
MKQNKENDFTKDWLVIFLKTHNFAKIKETNIPVQYPNMEANNIFLKIRYKVLKDMKLKVDAISPDTKNLNIC